MKHYVQSGRGRRSALNGLPVREPLERAVRRSSGRTLDRTKAKITDGGGSGVPEKRDSVDIFFRFLFLALLGEV